MENSNPRSASPEEERARLKVLDRYRILDTPAETAFDDLVDLACKIFNLPVALISFIGEDEIFFKANRGFGEERSEPRAGSICDEVIKAHDILVIEDVHTIPHLQNNPYGIRFYAGVPLITADGYLIGTLCVMNHQLMSFSDQDQEVLVGLAKIVIDRTELRLIALNEEALKACNQVLVNANDQITARNANLIEYQAEIAKANTELENIQDSFILLFELAPMAIGICSSPHHIFQRANAAMLKIFGTDHSLTGIPLLDLIPELEDQSFLALLEQVQESGKALQATELKLRISDGEKLKTVYANVSLQPIGRVGDEPHNIMILLADVTEQVIAKEQTTEANIVLMSAIDAAEMGYTIVEFATGRMVSNDRFKQNYGYLPHEEFDYSDLFDAMVPKYRQQIKKSVQEAIENNTVYEAEYEVKWRDGSIHHIRAYGKPRYDMHGRASHIIGLNKIIGNTGG